MARRETGRGAHLGVFPGMARNKLGLTEGATLALIAAPTDFALEVPTGVTIVERAARVVVAFVAKADEVEGVVKSVRGRVEDDGMMWFAYPKAGQLGTTCTAITSRPRCRRSSSSGRPWSRSMTSGRRCG